MNFLKRMFNKFTDMLVWLCGLCTGLYASFRAFIAIRAGATVLTKTAIAASGVVIAPANVVLAIDIATTVAPIVAYKLGVFNLSYKIGSIPGQTIASGVIGGAKSAITHAYNMVRGFTYASKAQEPNDTPSPSANIPIALVVPSRAKEIRVPTLPEVRVLDTTTHRTQSVYPNIEQAFRRP